MDRQPTTPSRPLLTRNRVAFLFCSILAAILGAYLDDLILLAAFPEISQLHRPDFRREAAHPSRITLDSLSPEVAKELGVEGLQLFRQHDRDDDGVLTLQEFLPIASRLLSFQESTNVLTKHGEKELELNDAGTLEVLCSFLPLDLQSLKKKFSEESLESLLSFAGLKNWSEPNVASRIFRHTDFKNFLPSSTEDVPLGHTWYVVKSTLDVYDGQLTSTRHDPPPVHPSERLVHELFAMFHKRPFIYPRFPPQGTMAMVRARTGRVVDIVFRSHVEFQLNDKPAFPFWFTPAQFRGRLTITVDGSTVYRFQMFAPADRKLNVDLEWMNGPGDDRTMENMEVDIGFVPRMELYADLPEVPAFNWEDELSIEEAFKQIEAKMYPFKQVTYYPFEETFRHAEAKQKLVHSIVLWGALDDQSC